MAKYFLGFKYTAISILLIGGILLGIVIGFFYALTHDLPQIRDLENYQPSVGTRIYSADEVLLAELFVEKREPVPLGTIPHDFIAALIATEDRKFYSHSGVDVKGIIRAAIKDISRGKYAEGASTITQQLAKELFLNPKKTLTRKIKEAFLAFQLERRYTKDEILELYINQIYFGSGAYGVAAAARIFFGKNVQDLSLAECALIAGTPKGPSRFSPLINEERAVRRRNTVLKQMVGTGIISKAAYQTAVNEPLSIAGKRNKPIHAPYFVEYLKTFLEDAFGSTQLYKGGLTVYSTLSFEMQSAAENAVTDGIAALEKRMKRNNITNPEPQCALVSLDVHTGNILAMVGGKDFFNSPFNRATMAKRQAGSAFKPIVYAFAIEQGFTQNKIILDAPVVYKGASGNDDWRPENFSNKFMGEVTLRKALALSINIPVIRLIETLGPSSVVRFGYSLGIGTTLSPNLSLALGTSEVTLIDLTSAYAVFPNQGKRIQPFGVKEVMDQHGQLLWKAKPAQSLVMSSSSAAIITNMLEGVVREGTGKKARILSHPVGGKTGTTNAYRDALFVGFSPTIATGVWVGLDEFKTMGKGETGARAALPIWIDFMAAALENQSYQEFDIPDDVVRVYMNPTTGTLGSVDSSDDVIALFKEGSEPKQ